MIPKLTPPARPGSHLAGSGVGGGKTEGRHEGSREGDVLSNNGLENNVAQRLVRTPPTIGKERSPILRLAVNEPDSSRTQRSHTLEVCAV